MKVLKNLGFTAKKDVYILFLLTLCIILSFVLAVLSIQAEYTGVLACWTACFTPLGVGLDIVLNSSVKKSMAENTGADGEGIRYKQLSSKGDFDI